ncbi:MAG: GNAT family N-acetyltransferase [Trueperaceae bacterium]|nr:MAG: GNAT family N-acetyltransferase [Trueperaceae bacterium]
MPQIDDGAIRTVQPNAAKLKIRAASEGDFTFIVSLLKRAGLPKDGLQDTRLYVLENGGRIVGLIGFEAYGDAVLLRSLVVEPTWRGEGYGTALLQHAIAEAHRSGACVVYGLTLTIADWLERLGFEEVSKSSIPSPILSSAEFQGACPASARLFRRVLASRSLPKVSREQEAR